jgi:hypothetical protein
MHFTIVILLSIKKQDITVIITAFALYRGHLGLASLFGVIAYMLLKIVLTL